VGISWKELPSSFFYTAVFYNYTAVYYYCDGFFYKCEGISLEQLPSSSFYTAVYSIFTAVLSGKMGNLRQLLPNRQNLLALFGYCMSTNSWLLTAFISSLSDNSEEAGTHSFPLSVHSRKLP